MITWVAFSEEVPLRQQHTALGDVAGAQVPYPPPSGPLPRHSAQHPQLFLAVGLEGCLEELPGTKRRHTPVVLFCFAMGLL